MLKKKNISVYLASLKMSLVFVSFALNDLFWFIFFWSANNKPGTV